MPSTYVIAEAGVNHNGSLELAKRLVEAARAAGADCVKFQSFKASNLATAGTPKADYQTRATGEGETQREMLERLELSWDMHQELQRHCRAQGITFLSTAFDAESIAMLCALGTRLWKVPSGEITNLPYLRAIGAFNQETFLSTGMATLGEVEAAIAALTRAGCERSKLRLLHCTTEYPAPFAEVNLRAMVAMGQAFHLPVGYSDHTPGIEIPVAAVALGATVIEKHFTLDRSLPGPDHRSSLEPGELAAMVQAIRNLERALGDGVKGPTPSEARNRVLARRSLVAAKAIQAGERFTLENLTAKRPGHGISPMEWDRVMGRCAPRAFEPDELIELP